MPRRTAGLLGLLLPLALVAWACNGDAAEDPAAEDPAAEDPAPTEPHPEEPAPDEPEHLAGVGIDAWTRLADAPTALTEVDAAVLDGEIWTVGGLAADASVVQLVQVYDPGTDDWREGPALPEPVHHAALVATDDTLVVIGGYRTLAFDPVEEVWVLDREAGAWSPGPPLPEARGAGAAAWDGERIVYGGGIGAAGLAAAVWVLADLDAGWEPLGELSAPRDHLDATSDGAGRVWFLAGRQGTLTANLGTVDLVEGGDVTSIGELPTPRGGVAAFHSAVHGACLAGGEQPERTFAEVECIDAGGATTTLPPLAEPRHGLGAGVVDGIAYVLLGGPEPALAVSPTVEALRLA